MQVAVRVAAPRGAHAARVLRAVAAEWTLKVGGSELSVSLVTDREIRRLNRAWRGLDEPTDVLSFELGVPGGPLGDVVISLESARRQARLFAHGLLHCRGYDHDNPRNAGLMAAAERRLLGRAGMVGESYPELHAAGRALGRPSPTTPARPKKK
jgi:probable rRNA maturation factor